MIYFTLNLYEFNHDLIYSEYFEPSDTKFKLKDQSNSSPRDPSLEREKI